jgi:hypothetical protein
VLAGCGTVVSAWALTDGAVAAAALLASVVALVVARSLWECGISVAVLTDAVHESEALRVQAIAAAESASRAADPGAPAVVATPHLQATG